jgi:phosphoglycerate dehydrogenase-like enzyme
MGHEVKGMTLGLVGIGQVGTRVAEMAPALGMKAIATDPFVAPEEIRRRGAEPVSLEDLIAARTSSRSTARAKRRRSACSARRSSRG